MERFEEAFGQWVVRKRWWLILCTVIVVLAAANGMQYLTVNNDTRVFFSDDNPQLKALEALENTYNKISNVLIAIAPKDGNVFTRETLAAVEELTENAWQTPYSSRVNSIANFQYTWAEDDDLIVEDLVLDAHDMSDEKIARVRKIALSEPELVNNLISPSGHVTGLNIDVILPGKSETETPEVAAFARNLAENFREKYPNIELYLAGMIMGDTAFGEIGQRDMATIIPLMFIVLLIIVGIALRTVTGVLATFSIFLFSVLTGMGIAGYAGIAITSASSVAPTIILTLAVADSVHILAAIFQQMRQGKTKLSAISESLRINLQPVFLTSITTAIGFLSMNFSDAPPFRDLGNIVAVGVLAAFSFSVLFLPSLIAVLPVRVKQESGSESISFGRFADLVINHRKAILPGMVIVMIAATAGLTQIDLNDQFMKYFGKNIDVRKATDFIQDNLTGWDVIEYSLESGESGGISEPEYLSKVEEFANWYRMQPKVVTVRTITNTMKRLNKTMHGDDDSYYRIPDQRDLAAQYLLLYEMSLPFGHDLNNMINVDKSSTRMLVSLRDTDAKEQRAMDEKARAWLKANAPESMFTYGTGLTIIWAHISERNINSMLGAAFGALVLISIFLIFALRSFKIGLLSLVPNLAPAIMAFGIWGIVVGKVGLGLSIVASMTLGIVVDDTIHFLSKYLRARREHKMDPCNAVRYSFNSVGKALWVTSLALVVGFLILTLSDYKMTSEMGLLSAITIVIALVLDFLLLPVLLMQVEWESNSSEENKQENRMKKSLKKSIKQLVAPLVLFFLLLPLAPFELAKAQTSEEKGLIIANETNARDHGFKDITANMLMTLRNKHGQESKRQIRIKTLEVVGDGDKSLMIFDNPKDVKGTASLSYSHKDKDDDQWLFLPALKRVKRINSRNKSGSFMGSEFSFEDIASPEIEKYTYKWIRDEEYEGQDCFVVEYYPVDKKNSGYTRQVTWIDKSEYRLRKVEFYDRKNAHLKTLTFDGYSQYLDKFWRANVMNMVNHQNGKSTTLEISNYNFGSGLKNSDFTKNALMRIK